MFIANTTGDNTIATRYAQLNRDDIESNNSEITNKLKNVKNDNGAVLKNRNFFDKLKAFPGRIFNRIRNLICLKSYDLTVSTTASENIKGQALEQKQEKEIIDKQIAVKILVDQLRKNKSVLKAEGLFRKAANVNKLKDFEKDMDKPGQPWIVSPKTDTLVICDAIKRLIPKTITTEEMDRFSGFKEEFLEKGTLPPLKDLPETYRIIKPLMEDMLAVAEENKMDAHNLATVIAPRFFPDTPETSANTGDFLAEMTAKRARLYDDIMFFEALLQEYCQENVRHESAA